MIGTRDPRRDRRGNMPMAMIAVALLVTGSFFCVINKSIESSTDNSESLEMEFASIDEVSDSAVLGIETALGNIITDISTSCTGNLFERSEIFKRRVASMFSSEYPSFERGVRTEILSHDISLRLESLRVGTGFDVPGSSASTFLRAYGTVSLSFTSETGSSTRTVEVSADATSCLPLVVENASRFELSTDGDASALTQMIEYQLTAIAQSRILAGYGMMSEGGAGGTRSIITEDDVRTAFRNALDILEIMCFRACEDGDDILGKDKVDLAELVSVRDGNIVIDLGAFYGQAIMANMDRYVTQWLDYIGANMVLDLADSIEDRARNILNTVIGFIISRDIDADNVKNHIRTSMRNIGAENLLILGFEDVEPFVIPGTCFDIDVDMEKFDSITEPFDEDISELELDLLSWDGWGSFYRTYNDSRNQFKESLYQILNSIAYGIRGKCDVSVPVDCFDGEGFSDSLSKAMDAAIEKSGKSFVSVFDTMVRSVTINDPLMCAVYQCIRNNGNDVFGADRMVDDIIKNIALTYYADLVHVGEYDLDSITEYVRDLDVIDDIRKTIYGKVNDRVGQLSVMETVSGTRTDILTNAMSATVSKVIGIFGLDSGIRDTMKGICGDIIKVMEKDPCFGVCDIPSEDSFTLVDGDGNVRNERMTVSDVCDIDIELVSPIENRAKNTHYVGFEMWTEAAYSAIYTVRISGDVGFEVRSGNKVLESLGAYDSSYSGNITIDTEMDIPCVSGWKLKGTEYNASNTLIGDAFTLLMKALEPFLDDLMNVLRAMRELERICSSVIIEFGNEINRMMTEIYETIRVPLEILQSAFREYFGEIMEAVGIMDLDIKLGSQTLSLDIFGTKVRIDTNLRSLTKNTKDIVKVTVSKDMGGNITAFASCTVKHNLSKDYYAIVEGGAEGKDWNVKAIFDPLLASRSYYVGIEGKIRDISFHGTVPELVQYKKTQLSVSEIPGVGDVLSNIPTPIPGVKCALDAGIYVKHALPIREGILINEVELNPAGDDRGKEWVEIFNNTDAEVNLEGYTLVPASGDSKSVSITGVRIPAKGMAVITFDKQTLNNSASKGNRGEMLTLYDTYGNIVDKTAWLTDTENNDMTNQRVSDGFDEWGFNVGSPGSKNGNNIPGGAFTKAAMLRYAEDAVVEIIDDMGGRITDVDSLMVFVQRVIARMIEKFIDTIADALIEAYVFVEVELTDYAETDHKGFRIMLGLDSEIVRDTLMYIASMIPVIGEHIACPEGMSAERIVMDDVYLRTVVYTAISAPGFAKDYIDGMKVEAGLSVKVNLSALSEIFGESGGKWSAEAGIVLEDFPTNAVPKCFEPNISYDSDLWLFRMTFSEA
ncbi:MAG: lamin tail domain-containing protein [Candidatus Methanomethylophilaceae archaeon]|nr:lamin tail domain-containing protein [Candidatus Methanomethylophilaceae archaeon]